VGVVHIKNVATAMRSIETLGKLPMRLDSVLDKELGDRDLTALIKLDASIDIALALDPAARSIKDDPIVAVSLPLKNLNDALAYAGRAGKPSQIKPGVYRVGRTGNMMCDLSVAIGDAPARLVCGEHERDVDELRPWLTRGSPTAQFGAADVHAELRAGPARERVQAEIGADLAALPSEAANIFRKKTHLSSPALLDAITSAAREGLAFGDDVDSLAIDISLDPAATQASFSSSIKFKANNSWVTKALTGRNDKAGPPPAIFWQAPKDSDSVIYTHGTDPKLFAGIKDSTSKILNELTRDVLKDKDRESLVSLVNSIPLVETSGTVSARGHVDHKMGARIAPEKYSPADAIKASQAYISGLLGWAVVGVDAKADPQIAWLRQLAKTYNEKSLQETVKKTLGKDLQSKVPTVKIVGAPRGTPAGTVALEIAISLDSHDLWSSHGREHGYREHPKGPAAKGTFTFTIVVMPDGDRTWVAFGSDTAALASHLAAVKDGAPKDGTIASREGLESLKTGPNTAAGFLSMAGLAHASRSSLRTVLSHREHSRIEEAIGSLPHKGETPVLLLGTGATGATPSGTLEVRLQKGNIEDLSAFVLYAMTHKNDSRDDEMMPPPVPETKVPGKGGKGPKPPRK
jgi:hypothetical protein